MKNINYIKLNKAYNNIKSMLYKNTLYTEKDLYIARDRAIEIIKDILNNRPLKNSLLKVGNHKLEKNILIWDIPEGMTCKGICKYCYALKASRIYKNTRIMRLCHLLLIEYALLDDFFYYKLLQEFTRELQKHYTKCIIKNILPICRIHSSGDIYSNEYKQLLFDVINLNNNINFYTYTKQLDNNEIDNINNTFKNFNIVKSIININNKSYINFGTMEHINNIAKELKNNKQDFKICDYGINNTTTCGGNCTACLHCSNILFKQH